LPELPKIARIGSWPPAVFVPGHFFYSSGNIGSSCDRGKLVDIRDIGPLGQLLSGLGTIVLALLGLWARQNYRRQVSLEQMRWLQQLYDSFYNSDRYKEVRQVIDFDEVGQTMELLRRGDADPHQLSLPERTQLDQFTDYLNFFEWLAYLEEEKQLTFRQLDTMFGYYLTRLSQVDRNRQLRQYIRDNGYEQLHRLLDRYSQDVSVPAARATAAAGSGSGRKAGG
jgi:hypothetical protein